MCSFKPNAYEEVSNHFFGFFVRFFLNIEDPYVLTPGVGFQFYVSTF